MTTQPKIDVSKLAKRFGTKQVLKEINLSIAPSNHYVLLVHRVAANRFC